MLRRNLCVAAAIGGAFASQVPVPANAGSPAVERGKYLVNLAGCNDCHTPGYFLGKPDTGRYLGGSDVGFELPGLGVFHGPNLTPDKETGLGGWTDAQIVAALQTGKRPDGRELAPIMPWHAFAKLIGAAEIELCRRIALRRGELEPMHCDGKVDGNGPAF